MSKYIISAGSYFKYAEICAKLGVGRNSGAVFIPEYELAGSNGLRARCEGLRAPDNKLIGYFSEFERFSLARDSQDDLPTMPPVELPASARPLEKIRRQALLSRRASHRQRQRLRRTRNRV